MPEIVTNWFGTFLFDRGKRLAAYPVPADLDSIRARMRLRRSGNLTPEEERLFTERGSRNFVSRDRRFASRGVTLGGSAAPALDPREFGVDPSWHRLVLLEEADTALKESWDPSVLVEQIVRAVEELGSTENLLAERLSDWAERQAPVGLPASRANAAEVDEARERLERLYRDTVATRVALEQTIEQKLPTIAPNLAALLGPLLAARMISLAGGLHRLARLPSSTVQVLGAEKAFFAHLQGRAPPPRHGLLFLHPTIHTASKARRGPLARALAGKVSIAARLDASGAAVRPELLADYTKRANEISARPKKTGSRPARRRN
jgi:nucleolar protein 56